MPRPDVIVIGGGIIGCALAYELSRRGASVTLLDHREEGRATLASAGMLAPYLEAPDEGPLLQLTAAALGRYDEFVARLSADVGTEIEYRRIGSLSVAMTDAESYRLESLARQLARHDVTIEWLDAREVRRSEPALAPTVKCGLVIRTHGYVSVSALADACKAAALRRGARVEPAAQVTRISPDARGALVHTTTGALSAPTVVIACGSWSGGIMVEGVSTACPVAPVRGQLVQLRGEGPVLRRVTWSDRCYLVPWQDGSVLVGATVEDAGFDARTTAAGVADLLGAALAAVPSLEASTFVEARAGLRPRSRDGLPLIGRSTELPHVVYATGHYRNGVLLAPLTAELIADLVLANRLDPLLVAVDPSRYGL